MPALRGRFRPRWASALQSRHGKRGKADKRNEVLTAAQEDDETAKIGHEAQRRGGREERIRDREPA